MPCAMQGNLFKSNEIFGIKNQKFSYFSKQIYYFREKFGDKHPKYSDALLDYGFYLLNVDSITAAVQVYQVKVLLVHLITIY